MKINDIDVPEKDSVWAHTNKNLYQVLFITNANTENPDKYPVTVVYKNLITNTLWSRKLSDWHRSMILTAKQRVTDVDKLLLRIAGGARPEQLSVSEIKLLEDKFGANWYWFNELGYSGTK